MKKLFVWLAGVSICAAQAVSIGPFATEGWVEDRLEVLTNDLATVQYVDDLVSDVEEQIPDVSIYATKSYVNAVSNAIPDVSGLATIEQVTAVSNLLPDVTDFATRQWVGQSITNAVDDLVVEWDSVTNKPVNVDPADGALKTNGRLKNGTYTSVNNKYSFASGEWLDVQSKGSVALGHQVSIPSSSSYTFAWSGDPSDNRYTSNGAGTFNVNPVGGTDGFYIGTNKLSDLLSGGGISSEHDPIFKSWADDNTNVLVSLSNLALNFEDLAWTEILPGTLVVKDNTLYMTKNHHTGAWDPRNFTTNNAVVQEAIEYLRSDIGGIYSELANIETELSNKAYSSNTIPARYYEDGDSYHVTSGWLYFDAGGSDNVSILPGEPSIYLETGGDNVYYGFDYIQPSDGGRLNLPMTGGNGGTLIVSPSTEEDSFLVNGHEYNLPGGLNDTLVTASVTNGLASKTYVNAHQWDWNTQVTNSDFVATFSSENPYVLENNNTGSSIDLLAAHNISVDHDGELMVDISMSFSVQDASIYARGAELFPGQYMALSPNGLYDESGNEPYFRNSSSSGSSLTWDAAGNLILDSGYFQMGSTAYSSSDVYVNGNSLEWPTDTNGVIALKSDTTLVPIYSDTPTFSEWTLNPATYNGNTITSSNDVDESYTYLLLYAGGECIGSNTYNENDTRIEYGKAHWSGQGTLVATRSRVDIIGYQLGTQTNKLLQPAGNYVDKTYVDAHQWDWVTQVTNAPAFVEKSGDTMTGGLTVPNLTVGSRASGSTVGANSTAEGEGTTASGDDSHADGYNTTASGNYSHAEGSYTTASGSSSHAEGSNTTASRTSSHAEGESTTASGYHSHAEGNEAIASGYSSHAEGQATLASGDYSHSEGLGTVASGDCSHTEGFFTVAQNGSEHAQGEYNASHTGSTDAEKTIHSIGVGTADNARTNAVEVMQDGKVFVKGVGGYDGTNPTTATNLATIINGKMASHTHSSIVSGDTSVCAVNGGDAIIVSTVYTNMDGYLVSSLNGGSYLLFDTPRQEAIGRLSGHDVGDTVDLGMYYCIDNTLTKCKPVTYTQISPGTGRPQSCWGPIAGLNSALPQLEGLYFYISGSMGGQLTIINSSASTVGTIGTASVSLPTGEFSTNTVAVVSDIPTDYVKTVNNTHPDANGNVNVSETDPVWTEFKDTHRIWSKTGTNRGGATITNPVVYGALAVGSRNDLGALNDLGFANGVVSIEDGGIYSTVLGLDAVSSNSFAFVYSGRGDTEYADHGTGTFNVDPAGGAEGFWIGETNLATYLANAGGGGGVIGSSNRVADLNNNYTMGLRYGDLNITPVGATYSNGSGLQLLYANFVFTPVWADSWLYQNKIPRLESSGKSFIPPLTEYYQDFDNRTNDCFTIVVPKDSTGFNFASFNITPNNYSKFSSSNPYLLQHDDGHTYTEIDLSPVGALRFDNNDLVLDYSLSFRLSGGSIYIESAYSNTSTIFSPEGFYDNNGNSLELYKNGSIKSGIVATEDDVENSTKLALDAIAPEFLTSKVYTNGDFVIKDLHLYECTNYTGQAGWRANDWQQTTVTGILGNLRRILDAINGEAL